MLKVINLIIWWFVFEWKGYLIGYYNNKYFFIIKLFYCIVLSSSSFRDSDIVGRCVR